MAHYQSLIHIDLFITKVVNYHHHCCNNHFHQKKIMPIILDQLCLQTIIFLNFFLSNYQNNNLTQRHLK